MFQENGEETLIFIRREDRELRIAVDDETYAHLLNDGWQVIEETCTFTRLPQEADTGYYDPSLRSIHD